MTEESLNTYDDVSYPGYPFPQAHPDRLATLAALFGMKPAPVDGCRVLEIGCGDGANLIPMALSLHAHRSQLVMEPGERPTASRLMSRLVGSGEIVMQREGRVVSDVEEAQRLLAEGLERNLSLIARLALLVA